MRKFTGALVLLLTLTMINVAQSQLQLGVKAGINVANVDYENFENKNIIRFNTGLVSQIDFNSTLFLRPELIYSVKGWGFDDGSMNLHYLNMPVLLGYKPIKKLSVLLGPELGYLLRTVRKPESPNFDSPYEKIDYGISIGASYNVAKSTAIEVRYTYGFDTLLKGFTRDANNNSTGKDRDGANRVLQFNVIYFF
jgi:hypothetical protein